MRDWNSRLATTPARTVYFDQAYRTLWRELSEKTSRRATRRWSLPECLSTCPPAISIRQTVSIIRCRGAGSNQTGWSWGRRPGHSANLESLRIRGQHATHSGGSDGSIQGRRYAQLQKLLFDSGLLNDLRERHSGTRPRRAKPLGHGSGGKLRKSLRSRATPMPAGRCPASGLTTALAGGSEARAPSVVRSPCSWDCR